MQIFTVILFGALLFLFLYALKIKAMPQWLLSALAGLAGLIASDLICGLFDFNIAVNPLSLSVCAAGGLPGCILLNLMNILFR